MKIVNRKLGNVIAPDTLRDAMTDAMIGTEEIKRE